MTSSCSMLWHRQAIFESKGDKLSSSAECRIRSWDAWDTQSLAYWMPSHKSTELSRIKLKKLELNSPSLWWASIHFSPLDFIANWLSHLVLAIYMFLVVNFDALAQGSDFRILHSAEKDILSPFDLPSHLPGVGLTGAAISSIYAGRCGNNYYEIVIFKLILWIKILSALYKFIIRWMPRNSVDEKSTLVSVMLWCHRATSFYLSQSWPRFMLPYTSTCSVTRPHWVNTHWLDTHKGTGSHFIVGFPSCG